MVKETCLLNLRTALEFIDDGMTKSAANAIKATIALLSDDKWQKSWQETEEEELCDLDEFGGRGASRCDDSDREDDDNFYPVEGG